MPTTTRPDDTDNSNEQVVVKPALPVISTTPAYGSSPVTLLDTADLSNGYYPTGTITFTLYLRHYPRGHGDRGGQR